MKLFMYDRYQLYSTRLVDITEENNSTYLKIFDDKGNQLIFQIKEMLVMDCLNEIEATGEKQQSVIYRGKIKTQDTTSYQTYFFKYIPIKKEWYICGNIEQLLMIKKAQ